MNADLQKEGTGLRISPPDEEEAPAKLYRSHRGNPLRHIAGFNPGDAIRATDRVTGLTMGMEYRVLGYWRREENAMYVYLEESPIAHYKWFRSAFEEKRDHEEVLFTQLPLVITEICIQDNLFGLEYVPALDVEVSMWPNRDKEPEDNVIPLHDKKGQFLLFNVA